MKMIVFDFDGTIANTLESVVQIYNVLAPRYGCKQLQPTDLERIRNGRPRDFMAEFGVTYWKLPFILFAARRALKKQIADLPLQPGLFDALQAIHGKGVKLGILTSNSSENVRLFLQAHHLENIFDFIISHRSVFGKDRPLKRLMGNDATLLYVGDEVRDIEAAKKAGVTSVAVAWGFQTEKALKASAPDYLMNEPDELTKLI